MLGGCAMPPQAQPGSLAGLNASWFYLPGPYQTRQRTQDGDRSASVTAEDQGSWTVTIGHPPTTVVVRWLDDGRPATASIANADRNETAVFEPPLALTPEPGRPAPATETSKVTLYRGLFDGGVPESEKPTRTGTAERSFLEAQNSTWSLNGSIYPAQLLMHELVLSLGPAQVRQRYESLAVEGKGIVRESMTEHVGVLGVRIGGREESTEVIEFVKSVDKR